MKFNDTFQVLEQKYLYHGAVDNDDFDSEKFKGIWFTTDEKSEILTYYSNRGGTRRVIKAELLTDNILDLSMYNVDEYCTWDDMLSFGIDLEIDNPRYIRDINTFFESYSGDNYNDDNEPMISISMVLNLLISEYMIPEHKYDGICIKEGNDEETYCIFDLTKIKVMK